MKRAAVVAIALLVACGACGADTNDGGGSPSGSSPAGSSPSGDGGTSSPAAPGTDGASTSTLGLNDVTVLVPEDGDALMLAEGTMDDGTPLFSRDLFERLALEPLPGIPGDLVDRNAYDLLRVVAVRFDLCDRNAPGPCAASDDGRVRLVLQPYDLPTFGSGFADVGFHAFYSVPSADLSALVTQVRELAELGNTPVSSPLGVSPPLSAGNTAYRDKLRAIVRRWTGGSKLVRLTMNAQPFGLAQIRWVMRGVEKKGADFVGVTIPGISGSTQQVITAGLTGFQSAPEGDLPGGILEALDDQRFAVATDARKRELLSVLASVDNPTSTATDTISCIGCHTSTGLMPVRSAAAGVDATSIPGRYASNFDLSVTGMLTKRRVIRALGWVGHDPLVSQRVVNDSAQVLSELATRF